MIALARVALQLLADAARFVALTFRPASALRAEILFLRRQLALYQERGIKPSRPDVATRLSLALLSRLFDWRSALVVMRPEALVLRKNAINTDLTVLNGFCRKYDRRERIRRQRALVSSRAGVF